ncbi:MAG: ABC transporter substrate-binding protein, partial [Betaproteobacteria bacterium]
PELVRGGVQLVRAPMAVSLFTIFSMRDATVGGDAQTKVALRRALAMAFDDDEYTRMFDAGLSVVQQQLVPPGVDGHVPGYRNPNHFDPATANALLDRVGFRRGPDGYRRNPDGTALTVPALTGTSSESRKLAEFTKRMLDRIGVRVSFGTAPASERIKRMTHCAYGMTTTDWALDVPDGANIMSMFHGKSIGSANSSCFADSLFDAAYEKALATPSGTARTELFRTMQTRLDAMAVVRMRPSRDMLLLKREGVDGPFPTVNDWLQVITLGVDPPVADAARRR